MPMETAPIMNSGPEVLEKHMTLSASVLDIRFLDLKLEIILIPVGYPDIMLMEKGKAEIPGTLNIGFINGSNNLPMKFTKPILIKISEIIKNGNNEGITTLNQVNKLS